MSSFIRSCENHFSRDIFCLESSQALPVKLSLRNHAHVKKICTQLGLNLLTDMIHRVSKPSKHSQIFFVDTTNGLQVLKVQKGVECSAVEAQCQVVSDSGASNIILPIRTAKDSFAVQVDEDVCTLYKYVPGSTFSGKNANVRDLLFHVWRLMGELARTEPSKAMPNKLYTNKGWLEIFIGITEKTGLSKLMKKAGVRKTTNIDELYGCHQDYLLDLVSRSAIACSTIRQTSVTHNDVHHANVIVAGGELTVIDIEDILVTNPDLAAVHAMFKHLRHTVYTGAFSIESARNLAPLIWEDLRQQGFMTTTLDAVSLAIIRIAAEVVEIISMWQQHGNKIDLFDLEKKLSNLVEAVLLLPLEN